MKSKFMNLKRSYIVRGYKYVKELREAMWERRIQAASVYIARPVCNQCGGEVVRLKHRVRMGKYFFKVTCLTCSYGWYTKKEDSEPDISQDMLNYADHKGLSVEDCLHIFQLKEKALNRVEKRRGRINQRAIQDAAAIRNHFALGMILKRASETKGTVVNIRNGM